MVGAQTEDQGWKVIKTSTPTESGACDWQAIGHVRNVIILTWLRGHPLSFFSFIFQFPKETWIQHLI